MDEIWLLAVMVFAGGVLGFLLGMFALIRVRELAKHFGASVPRIPGLREEQTFGLGSVVGGLLPDHLHALDSSIARLESRLLFRI